MVVRRGHHCPSSWACEPSTTLGKQKRDAKGIRWLSVVSVLVDRNVFLDVYYRTSPTGSARKMMADRKRPHPRRAKGAVSLAKVRKAVKKVLKNAIMLHEHNDSCYTEGCHD